MAQTDQADDGFVSIGSSPEYIVKSLNDIHRRLVHIEEHKGNKNGGGSGGMDDKDTQRLEDKINHVNEMAQLRLDSAMARIDGKFEAILQANQQMRENITNISTDIKSVKSTVILTAIASVIAIIGCIFAGEALWAGGFSSGQADRVQQTSAPSSTIKAP